MLKNVKIALFVALLLVMPTASCATTVENSDNLEKACFEAYYPPEGVIKDYPKAIEICGRLVEQENPVGYRIYGLMYRVGKGFPKDIEKARYYYGKIYEIYYQQAEKGLPSAELAIADIYSDSTDVYPVKIDPDKTLFWIEKAASHKPCNRGYVEQPAAVRRALEYAAYANKWGTHQSTKKLYEINYPKAFSYYSRLAEEFNYNRGHVGMATLLEEGKGVEKDVVEAYKHYLLGDTFKESTSGARNRLEKQMTREQIAAAKHRAKAWRENFKPAVEHCPPVSDGQ